MDKITSDEIKTLDEIYHKLVFANQKKETDIFDDKLKGATTIEVSILEMVDNNPDIILKEIVDKLGVPSSTLTNAINRLEKKNLIKRIISQKDKRSYGLELTDDGRLAQEEHRRGESILYKKILGPLNKDERKVFLQCLKKITDNL